MEGKGLNANIHCSAPIVGGLSTW